MGSKRIKRGVVYQRIVEWLPEVVTSEYRGTTVCIPASYHALEILKAVGIPAQLKCANAVAMNERFIAWMTREDRYEPLPPKAWSVGVVHDNPDDDGFLSHLVVASKGTIIDCAAGQLSRPEQDMFVPKGLRVKAYSALSRAHIWTGGNTVVRYDPSPEPIPRMWVGDPLATAEVRRRIEREIILGRFR